MQIVISTLLKQSGQILRQLFYFEVCIIPFAHHANYNLFPEGHIRETDRKWPMTYWVSYLVGTD